MIIVSTTRWAMPGRVFCSRSRRMAPRNRKELAAHTRLFKTYPRRKYLSSWGFYLCMQELFTVCDGASELQQAAEGERGYVSFAPAARLLLHILLKLDPARSLLPAHFMVLDDQLVQLHKQLRREQSRGTVSAKQYNSITNICNFTSCPTWISQNLNRRHA